MFLTKGYHGTSTAELCKSLQISKPTLYWHFENKEELLFSIHKDLIFDHLAKVIAEMKAIDDSLERLKYFIQEYVDAICKNPVLKILVHQNMFLKRGHSDWISEYWREMMSTLRKTFLHLRDEGKAKNLNDAFVAQTLIGMCTWPYYWFDYSKPKGIKELVKNIEEIFLEGILT